jgi:hypothetical protein
LYERGDGKFNRFSSDVRGQCWLRTCAFVCRAHFKQLAAARSRSEKWFSNFLRELGLRDETVGARLVGMHAFRHTLMALAFNSNPPQDVTSITGHSGGAGPVVAGYQGKLWLTNQLRILKAVTSEQWRRLTVDENKQADAVSPRVVLGCRGNLMARRVMRPPGRQRCRLGLSSLKRLRCARIRGRRDSSDGRVG